jgi:hypothetical protein
MEAKLYRVVYRFVMSIAHARRGKRQQFSDYTIVLVYLWSVLHQRPVNWACDPCNWPATLERPLPSDTTMSRRLKSLGVLQLLERVLTAAAELTPVPPVKLIDSKPLLVGAYSKDRGGFASTRDAKRGRLAANQMARGYRLHALSHGRVVRFWTLAPMNQHDSKVASRLLDRLEGWGYAVGDNAYDTNDLHVLTAGRNHQLIAPAQPKSRHVRDPQHNNVHRLHALDVLASPLEFAGQPDRFGVALYNQREAIESGFGEMTMMGLDHLPAWVRGPRRVARWTAGKILLYLIRLAKKKGLMT